MTFRVILKETGVPFNAHEVNPAWVRWLVDENGTLYADIGGGEFAMVIPDRLQIIWEESL